MTHPLFSILVPVYNAGKYLDECLESLTKQSFSDYEVVLIDDGSTDGCGEKCDAWRRRFPERLRVAHQANQGVVPARAAAFREARGEYLVFADADDLLHTDALKTLKEYFCRYGADMVLFPASGKPDFSEPITKLPFADGQLLSVAVSGELRRLLGSTFLLNSLWMKAFRRELVDFDWDFSPFSHITEGDDLIISLPVVERARRIVYCSRILYYYRENPGSITNSFQPDLFRSIRDTLRIQRSYAEKWDSAGALARECDRNALRKFYDVIVGICLSPLPGKRKRALLREVAADDDFLRCYAWRGTLEQRKLRLTLLLAKHRCFTPLCLYGRLKRTGRESADG